MKSIFCLVIYLNINFISFTFETCIDSYKLLRVAGGVTVVTDSYVSAFGQAGEVCMFDVLKRDELAQQSFPSWTGAGAASGCVD